MQKLKATNENNKPVGLIKCKTMTFLNQSDSPTVGYLDIFNIDLHHT